MTTIVGNETEVVIPVHGAVLQGDLVFPSTLAGLTIFAHGSGSSRHSPRNKFVANQLQRRGLGTLLVDLLSELEAHVDQTSGHLRFDINLLAERLMQITDWVKQQTETKDLKIGYFGASTGAAAALTAAAQRKVDAVVSRGGRPDLAGAWLSKVSAPTLLIVGGLDIQVIDLNEQALQQLKCAKRLEIVSGAQHLFEEPGALEEVARLAGDWFQDYLS